MRGMKLLNILLVHLDSKLLRFKVVSSYYGERYMYIYMAFIFLYNYAIYLYVLYSVVI